MSDNNVIDELVVKVSGNTEDYNSKVADALRTLEDFSKKTNKIVKQVSGNKITTKTDTKEIDKADKKLAALDRKIKSIATKTIDITVRTKELGSRAIGSIKDTLFSAPTAVMAGGFLAASGYALKLASDMEQANIGFTTMLHDGEKAKKFLAELQDFANHTPFEFPELRDASKKLLAFGFDAKQIIPLMTGIGNAASGLGLGKEGIDRITLAIGQIRAKSKFAGDEARQLAEAGIPVWEILSEKMKLSTQAVMKLSEKGLLPAQQTIDTLIDGMNKHFPNMMKEQSNTLQGLWSTMKDTFNNGLLEKFGEGISIALKPRFEQIGKWIDNNGETIIRWGKTLSNVASESSDWVLRKFESVFGYLKSHYFNNEAFTQLPDIKSKIKFVFEDLMTTFNRWYSDTGNASINDLTTKLVSSLATGVEAAAAPITDAGLKLGISLGSGIASGLQKTIAEHPLLSMLLGGLMGARVGGVWGGAIGFIGGGAAAFEAQRRETAAGHVRRSPEEQKYIDDTIHELHATFSPSVYKPIDRNPIWGMSVIKDKYSGANTNVIVPVTANISVADSSSAGLDYDAISNEVSKHVAQRLKSEMENRR